MTPDLAHAQQVLADQPFSVLLGAALTRYSQAGVEIRLPVTHQLLQQYGFVHGGVVSYLADNALTFAGGSRLRGQIVTSEYKLNYIKPAKGRELVARAEAISAGRTQAVARCEIYAVDEAGERLCAAAQGTISILQTPNQPPS